jgi:hypothetical protein
MPRLFNDDLKPTGCRAPAWFLRTVDQWRDEMSRDDPFWQQQDFFCRWCGEWHLILSDARQQAVAEGEPDPEGNSDLPGPAPASSQTDWCQWHRTCLPVLVGACSYCGAQRVHIHRDDKSARTVPVREDGVIKEKCAACHRENGVVVECTRDPGGKPLEWHLRMVPMTGGQVLAAGQYPLNLRSKGGA